MISPNLQRLAQGGDLELEAPSRGQFVTLVRLGRSLLEDARGESLSLEGRFNLVYGAAQALAAAALRSQGYRSGNRSMAFDCLPETAGLSSVQSRVLALCHDRRVKAEHEGLLEVDERLVGEAAEVVQKLLDRLERVRLQA
ncbi:MAG: hypothetical protein H7Y14_02910 [Burkholderiales bacterium]|nr:hypothetical protein [Burkholderiales bacterium]